MGYQIDPSSASGDPSASRRMLASFAAASSAGSTLPIAPIAIGAAAGLLAMVLAVSLIIWAAKRHTNSGKQPTPTFKEVPIDSKVDVSTSGKPQLAPELYSFNAIQVATDGFREDFLLSDSGHSEVYVGEGPKGELLAIKRAKEASLQGQHLFQNEVEFLSKIVHPNILELKGFCDEGNEQILVFDYMPNGALTSWLRPLPEDPRTGLSLASRLSIAVGVADALRYLHSFTKPTVIHRDVMADTILLDTNMKPKLGGLGLLKHLPGEGLRLRMVSKKGYLDPEYFQTFKVTAKCDVYSFGVVLLELLTGCGPIIQVTRSSLQRPMPLAQWAVQAVEQGKLQEIVDPRMNEGQQGYPVEVLEAFAKIACACVTPLRRDRPDMAKVAYLLAELQNAPSPGKAKELTRALPKFMERGHKVVPL